jgi:hypothetical protein
MDIYHKNGVWFYDAPAPPRNHEHWAESWAWTDDWNLVERCPCQAMNLNRSGWVEDEHPRVAPRTGFSERLSSPTGNRAWAALTLLCTAVALLSAGWGLTAPELNGRAVLSFIGFAWFAFLATEFHDMWKN